MNGEELTDNEVQALYKVASHPPQWMIDRIKAINEEEERISPYPWQTYD